MRQFEDGDQLHGPDLTALIQRALEDGSVVLDGCNPTAGAGDEVNVGSGTIMLSPSGVGDTVSVTSDTVPLSSRDSSERFDLVTVDGTGSVSATTGSGGSAPSLPQDEVLVAVVRVPEGGSDDLIKVLDARILTDTVVVDDLFAQAVSAADLTADDLNVADLLTLPALDSDPFGIEAGDIWVRTDIS